MAREAAWIIRRTSLRSERFPRIGERLELRTWCSGMAKSVAERTTAISGDGGAELEAVALWVYIDPVAQRPARLPAEFLEVYGESAAGNRPRSALRHPPEPPHGAEELDWHFSRSELDFAGHVNNTNYLRVAADLLPLESLADAPGRIEAEYRAGIGAGPARVMRSGSMLWICAPGGEVAATISLGGPEPA
jgi:acyl-ACP thioesterase